MPGIHVAQNDSPVDNPAIPHMAGSFLWQGDEAIVQENFYDLTTFEGWQLSPHRRALPVPIHGYPRHDGSRDALGGEDQPGQPGASFKCAEIEAQFPSLPSR